VASKSKSKGELGARYATALYEVASANQVVDQVAADLDALKEALAESAELRYFTRNPVIAAADAVKGMGAVMESLDAITLTKNFVCVVARNRRLFALPDLIEAFRQEVARRRGHIEARVDVARALTEEQTAHLEDTLKQIVGSAVDMDVRIDPSLMGGMVIRVGSRMIDNSLRTKINRLQIAMKAPGGTL